ncbi:hypothetical protein [Glycomyces artemisiae]|uniref:Uncharacterized protein n=1 Tax=Glycomyces artemisiae TaxID=1076443 RepID=A0A2T0UJ19_9ACTN|nr:hypothetical protein [Glycomyces artemisiae]PRY57858.1 hypothetical protein B0I28_106281 [Glycomyces artemisiae]
MTFSGFLLILLLLAGAAAFGGWQLLRRRGGPVEIEDPGQQVQSQAPMTQIATLHLPSSHLHFQFSCDIEYRYAETSRTPRGVRPRPGSVEAALYETLKELSSQFPLTRKDQLKYELTRALRSPLNVNGRFAVWGECLGVQVDEAEMDIIHEGYREELENERLRRRIEFLGKVFEDHRGATMWWLARHQDEIEQLPEKADLIYRVERQLNPEHDPENLKIGQDLVWFLASSAEDARSTVGTMLSGIYAEYGQAELARKAADLIPYREQPTSAADANW